MQLLSKSQVTARKNEENRLFAQQGAELAKRVDGLRKLSLEEERNLTTARTESLKVLSEELNSITEEREALLTDMIRLKGAREELLRPLTDEWATLNAAKESWKSQAIEIEEEWSKILHLQRVLQEKIDQVDENMEISHEMKLNSQKELEKSLIQRKEIKILSENLARDIEKFTNECEAFHNQQTERDRSLSIREIQLENRVKNFNTRERSFNLNVRKHRPKL